MSLPVILPRTLAAAGGFSHVMRVHRLGNLTICAGCVHHRPQVALSSMRKMDGVWMAVSALPGDGSCGLGVETWAVLFTQAPVIVSECRRGVFLPVAECELGIPVVDAGGSQHVQVKSAVESQIETDANQNPNRQNRFEPRRCWRGGVLVE